MNDLEKTVPSEEPLTPASNEACEIVNESVCAEEVSPAESLATVADAADASDNESVCVEEESPAESLSEVADAIEGEETEQSGPRFHEMTKEELNDAMKGIIEESRWDAHKEVAAIKQSFFNIRSRESVEEVNAFIEAGNDARDFSSAPDPEEAKFKEMLAEFKEKRADYLAKIEENKLSNLAKKQEILGRIKEISEDIDNINTKFPEFQQLQQDFKAIKEIPATAETEIWKNFQVAVEQFYDHLKMNKELRDLDFKKNLEAKTQLIAEAKKLEEMSDPVAAFRALQDLHNEWRNIGPVAKEIRESIWEEFKEASTIINKRHQDYFEQRKANEQANEEAKTKLCEEMEAIDLSAMTSFNLWAEATEKVIALQKQWKEYGFASKKANKILYTRFRKACDDFFEAKTAYFQKTREEFNSNLEKKTALCEKAEALKSSDDIRKATNEIVKLQAEWKKIGSVPRKQSDAIWQRFQTACNYFFDERKKLNASKREEETANLEAKRGVIAALKELPLDGDRKEVIGRVKELQADWQKIGFVPFKLKDKLYAEYREICDKLYGAYEERESRNRISNFRERVNDMRDGGQKLDREREKLMHAYESRKQELLTIENNMGFFNVKSSAGNSLVKEMQNKIKRLKEDMAQIEEKIAILDAE